MLVQSKVVKQKHRRFEVVKLISLSDDSWPLWTRVVANQTQDSESPGSFLMNYLSPKQTVYENQNLYDQFGMRNAACRLEWL